MDGIGNNFRNDTVCLVSLKYFLRLQIQAI